jgi:hypothetical protein
MAKPRWPTALHPEIPLSDLVSMARSSGLFILAARVEKVIALHTEWRIYDECGHSHTDEEVARGEAHDIPEVGITCEEGYLYSVCRLCHTDDGEAREDTDEGSWPCPTVRLLDGEDE